MLLFIDSFDHYATADIQQKWPLFVLQNSPGKFTIDPGSGRRGTSSLKVTYGAPTTESLTALAMTVPTSQAAFCCGFALTVSVLPLGTGAGLVQLLDSAGASQLALVLLADGRLAVTRGKWYGVQLAVTPTPVVTAGASIYVEVKVTVSATVGTVAIQVNGLPAVAASALNTQATANANWAQFYLGLMTQANAAPAGDPGGPAAYFDDFYLLDGTGGAPWNTFLGDVRVEVRRPTSEGAASDWAPSTGTDNAALVADATPDGDATYVSASSAPLTDTHVTEDATLSGIVAVQSVLSLRKSDAGACTVNAAVRSGGQVYVGPDLNPSTSYLMARTLFLTDPATNALWSLGGFNAAEFGYRRSV